MHLETSIWKKNSKLFILYKLNENYMYSECNKFDVNYVYNMYFFYYCIWTSNKVNPFLSESFYIKVP